MLFINFKTYEQATGKNAVRLAKAAEKVAKETGKQIILIPQVVDIQKVSEAVRLKVFAQHVDEVGYGSNTGHIMIDAVKQAGAKGTILNHSENRIPMDKIKAVIKKCKEKNFKVLVCAQDADEVKQIAKLQPDYVAYEPSELIGGDISVSTAKPEVIEQSVSKAGNIPLIVGAGVKNTKDVEISVRLGAKGILVASGVVKAGTQTTKESDTARNQEKAVKELIKGF